MSTDDIKVTHVHMHGDSPADVEAAVTALASFAETGVVPDGADITIEDFKTFAARGRAADCNCGLIQCACAESRQHKPTCRYRISLTCAVAIECEHGNEVCAVCDACDCGATSPEKTP